jgi:RHS repeat-associated protein
VSGTPLGADGVGGLILEKDATGEGYFPSYDGNGNLVGLVQSSSGTVSASYIYDPFGNEIGISGNYALQNPWRFSTKFRDQETYFLTYKMRNYSSAYGRWISRDLLGELGFEVACHKKCSSFISKVYNWKDNSVRTDIKNAESQITYIYLLKISRLIE